MRAMAIEHAPEPSQFRVTLFVGPQPVEGKPFTSSCVFNVKKRSWKGGIQVTVAITQNQIDTFSTDINFSHWLAQALIDLSQMKTVSLIGNEPMSCLSKPSVGAS